MSGFALAGTIVQFIELAAHVFNHFYEAYKSGYAITLEVMEKKEIIEIILTDMIHFPPLDSTASSATMNNVGSLPKLVEQYIQVAKKLLSIMEDTKVKDKNSIWASMMATTKGVRKRKLIKQLLDKLTLLGSAIIL